MKLEYYASGNERKIPRTVSTHIYLNLENRVNGELLYRDNIEAQLLEQSFLGLCYKEREQGGMIETSINMYSIIYEMVNGPVDAGPEVLGLGARDLTKRMQDGGVGGAG